MIIAITLVILVTQVNKSALVIRELVAKIFDDFFEKALRIYSMYSNKIDISTKSLQMFESRFFQSFSDSPEVKTFRRMVKSIKDSQNPSEIIEYFFIHFSKETDEEMVNLKIGGEITKIVKEIIPVVSPMLDNLEEYEISLKFLNSAIKYASFDLNMEYMCVSLLFKLMETDNFDIMSKFDIFYEFNFSRPTFMNTVLLPSNIIKLWEVCFTHKKNSHALFSQRMISSVLSVQIKLQGDYTLFYEAVLKSFDDLSEFSPLFYDSLEFLGILTTCSETCDFYIKLMPKISKLLPILHSFNFMKYFLTAQSSATRVIWNVFSNTANDPSISQELLESSIPVLYELKDTQLISYFDFNVFFKRAHEINKDSQAILFEILQKFDLMSKVSWVTISVPTWMTGIEMEYLSKFIMNTDWQDKVQFLLQLIIIDPPIDSVFEHRDITGFAQVVRFLTSKITKNMTIISALMKIFIELSFRGDANFFPCISLITDLTTPPLFIDSFIEAMKEEKLTTQVYTVFTALARYSQEFAKLFIENGGIEVLFSSMKSNDSVDFLAALACYGPVKEIDDYIRAHFDSSYLASLDDEHLSHLMKGINHDSKEIGMLRIPSLIPRVKNIMFSSPYERYLYATESETPNAEAGRQYMSTNDLRELIKDGKNLPILTSTEQIPFDIYQFHINVPGATATYKNSKGDSSTCSFWFYFDYYCGPTTLLQNKGFGNITFELDHVTFACSKQLPCSIREWHLLSFITNDNSIFGNNLELFYDGQKVLELSTDSYSFLIGSEHMNNAIWYISSISNSPIQTVMENGPKSYHNEDLIPNEGCIFVPYQGFHKYLPMLGGQEFIFNQMISAQDLSHSLKAAINLLKFGEINIDFFYKALKSVFLQRNEILFNDVPNILNLLPDYLILTHPSLQNNILEDNRSDILFLYILDTFCFFDNKNTYLEILKIYLKEDPQKIVNILYACIALANISSDELLPLSDEDNIKKQKDLFELVLMEFDHLPKCFSFSQLFDLASSLNDELALEVLLKLFDYCIKDTNYVSKQAFLSHINKFYSLVNYESLWILILEIITESRGKQLSDFVSAKLVLNQAFPYVLDLLLHLMKQEITSGKTDLFSMKILEIMLKFAPESEWESCHFQLRRLLIFGLDQPEQFSESPTKSSFEYIKNMNPDFYQQTVEYLQKNIMTYQHKDEVEENDIRINFNDLLETESFNQIIKYVAKVICNKCNDSYLPNYLKIFTTHTIFDNDIKCRLHQKIILNVLKNDLNVDAMSSLIDLLLNQVLEGWWIGLESELLDAIKTKLNVKIKNAKSLVTLLVHQSQEPPDLPSAFAGTEANDDILQSIDKTGRLKLPEYKKKPKAIKNFTQIRMIQATYIRRAFRYQFFIRFNRDSIETERTISKLFISNAKQYFLENPPLKIMIAPSPNPFAVPQKVVPLVYTFTPPEEKSYLKIPIPHSLHSYHFDTKIQQLCEEKSAAQCFEKWMLPPYMPIELSQEFIDRFRIISPLFECNLLSTPEVMPCVAGYSKSKIHILMNSVLENGEIKLLESSDMLCHYEAFEAAPFGYHGACSLFCHHTSLEFPLNHMNLVLPRRFAFRNQMVDIFTENGIQQTLIFKENDRKTFLSKIKSKNTPKLLTMTLDQITKMWLKEEISSYDYLIYLSIIAGRSFHDLSQYPIFPWILGKFEESEPVVARDISKPMGAQTPDRIERVKITYEETQSHYGTHYSQSATVLHFMIRIEPYTFFSMHLHNGWDHMDRLFCNLAESWHSSSSSNQADNKELIPEFYSVPMMFSNPNNLKIGKRSDGHPLDCVVIPTWAKDTLSFVWTMRSTLENEENLDDWIDLIFGYKQRGQEAINALNVFQPLSYDNCPDEETQLMKSEKAIVDTINNFGQIPKQLMTVKHPKRELKYKPTLTSERILFTPLKIARKNVKRIIYQDEEFVYLRDVDEKHCTSNDQQLTASVTKFGVINVYNHDNFFLNEISVGETDILAIAVSSQYYALCVATPKYLILFDISTGFISRKKEVDFIARQILFDDTHNFIVIRADESLEVYGFDFEFVSSNSEAYTCCSVCNECFWCESPIYLAGKKDGVLSVLELNIYSHILIDIKLEYRMNASISACLLFCDNKAGIVVDEEGETGLLSIRPMNKRFVKLSCFSNCKDCKMPLKGLPSLCSVCGLPICKACQVKRFPPMCEDCVNPLKESVESYASGRRRRSY